MNYKIYTFLLLLFYNMAFSNDKKTNINEENYTVTIPSDWNYKRTDSLTLVFTSNYKNEIFFYINEHINKTGNRPNVVEFSRNYTKGQLFLGNNYKTIQKDDGKLLKFYSNSKTGYNYIIYYHRDWNNIYSLLFKYKNIEQEITLNRIINSFDTSISFSEVRQTKLFKNYFFSAIALLCFLYLGFKITKSFYSIYFLHKIKKKYKGNVNLKIWNKKFKKSIKKIGLNLLVLLILTFLFYSYTSISTYLLFATLISAFLAILDPPDILEGLNNVNAKIDISADALDIDGYFDTDIDF